MKNTKIYLIKYIILLIAGVSLIVYYQIYKNEFWVGMGIGFIMISAMRLVQLYRYKTDKNYAKNLSIKYGDERNKYVAEKARSITFTYCALASAVAVIILRIAGFLEISTVLGLVICVQLIMYLITYHILCKKL